MYVNQKEKTNDAFDIFLNYKIKKIEFNYWDCIFINAQISTNII